QMRARLLALALATLPGATPVVAQGAQEYFVHTNGDVINGEIKGLSRGKLQFKIPGSGTFSVDWPRVAGVFSPQTFEVERLDGERFFGTLRPGQQAGTLDVVGKTRTVSIPLGQVLAFDDIAQGFWSRLDGFVEFGFAFAKANKALNYSLEGAANYRTRNDIFSLKANSFLQDQSDAEATKRSGVTTLYTRLLANSWSLGGLAFGETNQQLELDLRLAVGAVGGRDFVQSTTLRFNGSAGVLFSRETFVDVEGRGAVEGLLAGKFEWFTFASNETDLTANLMLLPSFTQSGRVRLEFDIKLKQDFLSDFYLSLSFYDTYDSEPPTGVGSTNDYGTTLALGWDP
ncbi:MAG: DUF481 domain-containing protein, partial [Gemmatimonadota bacterium]